MTSTVTAVARHGVVEVYLDGVLVARSGAYQTTTAVVASASEFVVSQTQSTWAPMSVGYERDDPREQNLPRRRGLPSYTEQRFAPDSRRSNERFREALTQPYEREPARRVWAARCRERRSRPT